MKNTLLRVRIVSFRGTLPFRTDEDEASLDYGWCNDDDDDDYDCGVDDDDDDDGGCGDGVGDRNQKLKQSRALRENGEDLAQIQRNASELVVRENGRKIRNENS